MQESEISKAVQERLNQWESWDVVLFHDRYNAGHIQMGYRWVKLCKTGHPDRIAYLNINNTCWIYLIEVKTEEGIQSPKQCEFEEIFQGMSNVVYELVRSSKQIDITLERISRRTELLFQDADIHMGLKKLQEEEF